MSEAVLGSQSGSYDASEEATGSKSSDQRHRSRARIRKRHTWSVRRISRGARAVDMKRQITVGKAVAVDRRLPKKSRRNESFGHCASGGPVPTLFLSCGDACSRISTNSGAPKLKAPGSIC